EQLDSLIKSAVNSSGPLPPCEKFSQIISALRELRELRAAMLHGAENPESPTTIQPAPALDSSPKIAESPSGNSPVIPDGWVACSERMPYIGVPVITCCGDVVQYAAYAWDGKEWQDWYEEYDKLPASTFTHWHPRPAAPQQEVKP
ncbi:DUF551 domain-containing protein, partial [Enterobacter kobei]